MWKILNRLFGWDYVSWQNSCDDGIARVYFDGDGQPYFFRYKITKLIDQLNPKPDGMRIIWLTCKSDKYLNK